VIIYETPNYKLTRMRVGFLLENKITREEAYFQPGDPCAAMSATVDALDEVENQEIRDTLFDIACAEYF
jgi:hypothetical protein